MSKTLFEKGIKAESDLSSNHLKVNFLGDIVIVAIRNLLFIYNEAEFNRIKHFFDQASSDNQVDSTITPVHQCNDGDTFMIQEDEDLNVTIKLRSLNIDLTQEEFKEFADGIAKAKRKLTKKKRKK